MQPYKLLIAFPHFEINLYQVNTDIKCEVTHLSKNLRFISLIIGLDVNHFSRFASSSGSFFKRFLHIDEKTLRVAYTGGLQGGGACVPKKKTSNMIKESPGIIIIKSKSINKESGEKEPNKEEEDLAKEKEIRMIYRQFEEEWQEKNENLEKNQKIAIELARTLSKAMKHGTVDRTEIKKLSEISPYECAIPQGIAELLLENFNQNAFWAAPQYIDDRSEITSIIRRFLMVGIMKNPRRALFSKQSTTDLITKLEEITDRIEINTDYPEICTSLEITATIRLISKTNSTVRWWNTLIVECRDIVNIALSLKKLNPGPLLIKICDYYNKISRRVRGSYIDFMINLEVLEKAMLVSNEDSRSTIQEFIFQKFSEIPEMSWEEVHLLLDFAIKCINFNKVSEDFAISFIEKLGELISHGQWKIREKCATTLRHLRGNDSEEVKSKASNLHQVMKQQEYQRNDTHDGVLNILRLMPLRCKKQESKFARSNIHNIGLVLGRENEILQIERYFRQNNIVAVVGKEGVGKTAIVLKYGQENMNYFKIVWQINSESDATLMQGMNTLAKELGIKIENNQGLISDLMKKLNGLGDDVLIILDNSINQSQIRKFYTDNTKIKYLASSISEEWEQKILVPQLSPETSVKILQNNLGSSTNIEEIKELASVIGTTPLSLEQSAGIIMNNKLEIQSFLKLVHQKLTPEEKMQEILRSQFYTIPVKSTMILELISVCISQSIPEYMIKELFLEKYIEDDWWESRSMLISCNIVSLQNMFWNIHNTIHEYITNKYHLEDRSNIVGYYSREFVINDYIWLETKKLHRIMDLKSHVEKLVNSIDIQTLQEFGIFYNIINYYMKIDINYEEASHYLEITENSLQATRFSEEDLITIYDKLGVLYRSTSNFEKSTRFYLRSMKIQEKTLPPSHPSKANLYMNLGVVYSDKADYRKSEEYFLKALSIKEEILSPDHSDFASLYMNLGNLYRSKTEYHTSENFYLKALKIREASPTPNQPEIASLCMNLGVLYRDLTEYRKSEEYLLKPLKIFEEIHPANHPDLASLYMNLGVLYWSTASYDKSEEYYLKCLNIREAILPEDHPDIASLFMNLGNLYNAKADYVKSEEFSLKALNVFSKILPNNHPDIATLYMNLGVLYGAKTDYTRSAEYYLKAYKIREEILPANHPSLATLCMNLGNLYSDKADYDKCEVFYLKALRIRQEILQADHPDIASLYMNLGVLYSEKHDFGKSEEYYLKAITLFLVILQPNHPSLASLYMNLGVLYRDIKKYEKSEEFYLKALKIREEILSPKHPALASLFMNLGNLYWSKKDFRSSEEFFLKALKIREETLSEKHPLVASLYMNLGVLYADKGDFGKSEEFYLKSLKIREEVLEKNHPDMVSLYNNLGNLYKLRKMNEKSEEFYGKASRAGK